MVLCMCVAYISIRSSIRAKQIHRLPCVHGWGERERVSNGV